MNEFERGLLTYLSENNLKDIQSKQVGIAGCGGLGSNTALILTRCGFKRFTLLDFDTIEAANLNRQQYNTNDIGELKTHCLLDKMQAINPGIDCRIANIQWEPNLMDDPFLPCNILVEAFDRAESKTALVDYYSDKISYIVSGNGLAGITGPALSVHHCGNIFFVGDRVSEADTNRPPMAPRVITCAAMMAEIVLSLTLNQRPFSSCDVPKE